MSKRDRIAALLRKAGDKGASEAEAMEAMRLAQKIAAKEGLTLEDIQADNEEAHDFIRRDIRSEKSYLHPVDRWLRQAIAEFTCTKAFSANKDAKGNGGRYVVFFGHAADIELALFIRETCMKALENSWWVYKNFNLRKRAGVDFKAERYTFVRAFARRMSERMKEYTRADAKQTGTDLIVVKHQLVEKRFTDYCEANSIGVTMEPGSRYRANAAGAAAAGAAAASNVDLGRGVQSSATRMIGKG